ncbi:MAG: type II secretion system GspH family protein [Rhodocyclaceae bacterium]|nr:type II secretion system GspH family protein [Rhodocyclaceae bacterium]
MSFIERQRGLTLTELILFIVIVGAAVAGVLSVFVEATRRSADPLIRKQAMAVAESLLEEILAVPYTCPPGATCNAVTITNRTATHALADYNGFTMTGICALDGTVIPQLSGYTAKVEVADEGTWNGANGRLITVTVSAASESVSLTGWRGAY